MNAFNPAEVGLGAPAMDADTVGKLLEAARWAPSGDNTQPWRFEVLSPWHWRVHSSGRRADCVYDLDGHSTQIAMGALLETLHIAASEHGLELSWKRLQNSPETAPSFEIRSMQSLGRRTDPLLPHIRRRRVQRRAMRARPLAPAEKHRLELALGRGYGVLWLEGWSAKARMAGLLSRCAGLRLSLPEAYPVHRDAIQWRARFSEDRIPDQALGLDPLTLRLMRCAMRSWRRVDFCNRYLAASWLPRLEMDLLPALACGAHFLVLADDAPRAVDDYVDAGRAMQRFWLTATQLGLQLQPSMTPLVFARYAREGVRFSGRPGMDGRAQALSDRLAALFGGEAPSRGVFMGRIGEGPEAAARSLRRPLDELMVQRRE